MNYIINTNHNTSLFVNCPDVLTMKDLSNVLQVGRTTAYKLIENNEIKHFRVGSTIRIPKVALMEYVENSAGICHNEVCSSQANSSCHQEGVYAL